MSNALYRFEAIADLYHSRTGYLRPGKSAVTHDANSEDNRERFENWLAVRGFSDAIDRIVALDEQVKDLENKIEGLEYQIEAAQ